MNKKLLKKIKPLISIDPKVMNGMPRFKNTRIPVSLVAEHFKMGWTDKEINELFPDLNSHIIDKVMAIILSDINNGKNKKSRGLLTLERTVYPSLHKLSVAYGWTSKRISLSDTDRTDESIAKKYGKGRSILLTHDKDAYKHNVKGGFKGYIVYSATDKKKFPILEEKIGEVLSSDTSKTLTGYRVEINVAGCKKKKAPIPK